MWNETKFESHLQCKLQNEHNAKGDALFTGYCHTRNKLIDNVFDEVKGLEPNLTDHGARHIKNVLENAFYLIGEDDHGLSSYDLYLLAMSILFHDVGNAYGRENHQNMIGPVYDWARGNDAAYRREKTLLMRIVKTHTGHSLDGSRDTLKDLAPQDQFESESIQLQNIGTILRFADELAEGPQRTSDFRRTTGLIDPASEIYHDYASITNIQADRGNGRILISYDYEIKEEYLLPDNDYIENLFTYVNSRIIKLDDERRYAAFYSDLVGKFRRTEVTFNFHYNKHILPIDMGVVLDDKVVPGEGSQRLLEDTDGRFSAGEIKKTILSSVESENNE